MNVFACHICSLIPDFLRSERTPGQADQGRIERGVLRTRASEDAEVRRTMRVLRAVGCVVVAMGLSVPVAQADTQIESFQSLPSFAQAGGHPNILTVFTLSSHQAIPTACACNDARDVTAHLPAGLIGNPHATPQCDIAQFSSEECPVDSQVGVAYFGVSALEGFGAFENQDFLSPVYNMVPPPTQPALLAFKSGGIFDTPTFENVSARTDSDYGLDVAANSIEHFAPLTGFEQLTWGVPADPANDNFRFGFGQQAKSLISLLGSHTPAFCDAEGHQSTLDPATILRFCPISGGSNWEAVGEFSESFASGENGPGYPVPSNSPPVPFIQNPTTCETPFLTDLEVLSYDGGITNATAPWPATTGCNRLTFNPSQAIEPTTHAADSPSGAEFRLTVPQYESPSVPSPSELKAAVVTFPSGFSLAPNVTNGKTTCTEAQAKMGAYASTEEGHCPEDAKIGTISVDTPVLPGPLNGAAYLGEPKPGNRFRIFLVFDGFGVHVKIPGTVTPDPVSGQIHISFQNLPQAPFESFNMHIFGAERGPLDTPTQCGTYEVTSEWTPWDSALSNQTSRQFFAIDEGPGGSPCPGGPRPFHPSLQAAATANSAGRHTDFWLDLRRQDGDQNLSGLTLTTPPGFAATLKGLTYCPDASIAAAALESHLGTQEQAAPSCPASSYVGELTAGGGPGSHPLYLPGKAYLAGPYKGAPLSFVFITPAVSAGYDLGNVLIRAAVHIDPETAQVTTVSDPLPQVFQGIPLRLRQVFVDLNRPGFALNPTDCDPSAVSARLLGDEGATSNLSTHFQVASCASLPFAPKLALRLTGSTKQAGNPALTAILTARPGEANISRTQVILPSAELIDNAHINTICTRVQFAEGNTPGEKCPPGSILGFARAETPLLSNPLEGPIYLRSTGRASLPDIVAALNGQIDIVLDGHVDSVHGRLRTTFQTVPDAPVTKFTLHLDGGHKGLLENSPELCAHAQHFTAAITGQNGKAINRSPLLSTSCRKKHRRKARAHHKRRAHR